MIHCIISYMEGYFGVQRGRLSQYIVWARRTVLHTTMSLSYLQPAQPQAAMSTMGSTASNEDLSPKRQAPRSSARLTLNTKGSTGTTAKRRKTADDPLASSQVVVVTDEDVEMVPDSQHKVSSHSDVADAHADTTLRQVSTTSLERESISGVLRSDTVNRSDVVSC